MADGLRVTPETKVGELLDAHPDLIDALVAIAPAFGKLRNPVLRRTVARFATLADAAKIGGIPVPRMVALVREHLGLPALPESEAIGDATDGAVQDDGGEYPAPRVTIDADAELAQDRHPLGRVLAEFSRLAPGEALALESGFRPEPLIAELRRRGARVACRTEGERFVTLIARD